MLGSIAAHYAAAGGGGYSGEVLADSPLAYWRLGEASGTTMADSSGNGRTGTYSGTYTLGATGLVTGDTDTCVDFTNGQSLVEDAAWMDVAVITVEAIVLLDSVSQEMLVERDSQGAGGGGRSWQFRLNSGKFEFIAFPGPTTSQSVTTLSAGTKYHLAATYDGTEIRLYINGVLDKTTAKTGALAASGQPIHVGRSWASGSWPTDGRMDEVAIYGTALSASRIAAHAAAM